MERPAQVGGAVKLSSQGCGDETSIGQYGHQAGKHVLQLVFPLACLLGGLLPRHEAKNTRVKRGGKERFEQWHHSQRKWHFSGGGGLRPILDEMEEKRGAS